METIKYYIIQTPKGGFKRVIEGDPKIDHTNYTTMGCILGTSKGTVVLDNGDQYNVAPDGTAFAINRQLSNAILELNWKSQDNSVKLKMIFIQGRKIHGYANDKTFPKVTQCLLFRNGLLLTSASATKCDKDIDNLPYVLKLVAQKALDGQMNYYRDALLPILDKQILNIK